MMLRKASLIGVAVLLLMPPGAGAKKRFLSGWEGAFGAGVVWTSYHDGVLSPLQGRLGLRVWDHLALGAGGGFNTQRYLGGGYAALYLDPDGPRSMYVRGEYGVQGEFGDGPSDEEAIAYAVGVTFGRRHYKWYVEYHHLTEPGYSDGFFLGFIWYQRR